MIGIIKCTLGLFLVLGGLGLQSRSKNKDLYDYIVGTEFVLAGMVVLTAA